MQSRLPRTSAGRVAPVAIALLYMVTGLTIAMAAGMVIGRVPRIERGVEEFVWQMSVGGGAGMETRMSWAERFGTAWQSTREIVGKVWIYVVVGIAVGAFIHGYVPDDALAGIMVENAWWSVPAAVIPVVQALIGKGAALAFMMSVVALSLPEMFILRRVLKLRLIVLFVAIVSAGIIVTGYLFNLVI